MKLFSLILILLSSFASCSFSQSGWTKQKGELYSQLTYSNFSSTNFYSTSGHHFNTNKFSQRAATLYAEYGINDRLTTIINTNFFQANRYQNTYSSHGLGDLKLELKYALSKKIPLAFSIAPEIPLGTENNFVRTKQPDEYGFISSINLPTTDGEFNVWSTLAISSTFLKNKFWSSLYFSHNIRTKGYSNQFKSGVEVGYKVNDKLYFKTTFSTLGNFTNTINKEVSFIRGEGTRNTAFSIGVGYTIYKTWGVVAEYYQGLNFPVKARNTYLGPLFSGGITYVIKPKTT